jgi:hypothetical protein
MAAALILVSGELKANSPDEDQSVVNYSYAVIFGRVVKKLIRIEISTS